eukprot:2626483-Amphidinium_carterae.1
MAATCKQRFEGFPLRVFSVAIHQLGTSLFALAAAFLRVRNSDDINTSAVLYTLLNERMKSHTFWLACMMVNAVITVADRIGHFVGCQNTDMAKIAATPNQKVLLIALKMRGLPKNHNCKRDRG